MSLMLKFLLLKQLADVDDRKRVWGLQCSHTRFPVLLNAKNQLVLGSL